MKTYIQYEILVDDTDPKMCSRDCCIKFSLVKNGKNHGIICSLYGDLGHRHDGEYLKIYRHKDCLRDEYCMKARG
jgi:hypothetical protein